MGAKPSLNTFGERLTAIRKQNKYNQADFAELADVSQPTYSRIEAGESSPDVEFLQMIKEKFNIDLNWLICGDKMADGCTDPLETNILERILALEKAVFSKKHKN